MRLFLLKIVPAGILLTCLTTFTPMTTQRTSHLPAQKYITTQSPYNDHELHIVFDFYGVQATTSTTRAIGHLGLWNLIKCKIITGKSSQDINTMLFNLMRELPSVGNPCNACTPDGTSLPGILCDWQRGIQSSQQVYDQLRALIQKNNHIFMHKTEQILLERTAQIMLMPDCFAQMQQPIDDAILFIQECINNGHQVYILSNYDSQTFAAIYKNPKFKKLFSLFNPDHIIISGDCGFMKPQQEIFKLFEDRFPHIHPKNIIFIDDQQENIKAAQQVGWNGIICPIKQGFFNRTFFKHPDFETVRTQLYALRKIQTTYTHKSAL